MVPEPSAMATMMLAQKSNSCLCQPEQSLGHPDRISVMSGSQRGPNPRALISSRCL
jgi:hypothetical protein